MVGVWVVYMSQGSLVSIVSDYELDDWTIGV
jgi:hypothetical protein